MIELQNDKITKMKAELEKANSLLYSKFKKVKAIVNDKLKEIGAPTKKAVAPTKENLEQTS